MKTPEPIQMIYRYLRRRKGYITLLLITIGCLYILSGGLDSLSEYSPSEDYDSNCKFPCFGQFCPNCQTTVPPTVKVVNIAEHLKLKEALRSFQSQKHQENVSSTDSVCKRPNFDLNHDSVKYAFFHMDALNCSKEELFYVENDVFRIKKEVLGDRPLEKCQFYGIERVSDDFASYSDPLTVTDEPFDVVLKHDFVRIKCFLKNDDSDNAKTDDIDIKQSEDADHIEDDNKLSNMDEKVMNQTLTNSRSANFKVNLRDKRNDMDYPDPHIDVQRVLRMVGQRKLNRYVEENDGFEDDQNIDDNDEDEGIANLMVNDGEDDEDNDQDVDYYRELWYDQFEEEADFDQLLVQVHPKPEIFKVNENKKVTENSDEKMNVLMFGLDSMSHLSYRRKLPLTYKYLKEELNAVVMDGYNIVGDATTAALIPMLTGKLVFLISI